MTTRKESLDGAAKGKGGLRAFLTRGEEGFERRTYIEKGEKLGT
jgi:hypothetical protein